MQDIAATNAGRLDAHFSRTQRMLASTIPAFVATKKNATAAAGILL
jgi:hypothetical protein